MALTFVDLRRRGRRLRLVHFQRLQNGKILVLNSLFLYVLVSALSCKSPQVGTALLLIASKRYTSPSCNTRIGRYTLKTALHVTWS